MIILIHGDNTATSRNYFLDLTQKTKNPIILDGSKVTVTDVAQILEGGKLFEDSHSVFIENFFAKRKPGKEVDALIAFFNSHQKNHTITLWESKALSLKQIHSFKEVKAEKFDFPKVLFSFLDSIVPGNTKKAIELFHKTIQTQAEEFVFFMLVRHFRILLALRHSEDERSENSRISQIDELKRLASWQKDKLIKQACAFPKEQLVHMYNKLFLIEEGLKTGALATTLDQSIDFLLASL